MYRLIGASQRRALVTTVFLIAWTALQGQSAEAEVGGTITAAPSASGVAYFGDFGAPVPMDISIDNNKGGQVAVTLTWCDAHDKRPVSLTVNPGLSEGQAIMFGGAVTLPPPGPVAPCNGGLTQQLLWSCAKSTSPKPAPGSCKFEFKVERHCLCSKAAGKTPTEPIVKPTVPQPQ